MFLDIEIISWTYAGIWLAIFVVTLVIELQTFNLTTIWFSISALVAIILALFGVGIIYQVITFFVLSIALLIATKPLVKKLAKKPAEKTNMDRVIGATAIVTKAISPNHFGEVIVYGAYWRAVTENKDSFEVDEEVIVEKISGVKLIVIKKEIKEN